MSVPPEFLNSLFIRKSLFFAGHSLLVYDYLLTFSHEVEYVWGSPWTVVKATFLLNRYGNLVGQSIIALEETGSLSHGSEEFCTRFNLFGSIFAIFSIESIHILVLMRAWAIWGCTYRAAVLLILLYVVYILVVVGMAAYIMTTADFVDFQYLAEIGVCVEPIPRFCWVLYATTLLLDTGMFATVMYSLHKFSWHSRHLYPSALLRLLVRDAAAFYIMGLTALQASACNSLFTIVCWTVYSNYLYRKQDPRNLLQLALSLPLLSIVGQRLVLNLRGFQTRHYTTRDLSREINRQMAAMGGTSFWQVVDQPNGVHGGGPRDLEWSESSGATPTTDAELKDALPSAGGARPPTTEGIYEVLRADEEVLRPQTTTSQFLVWAKICQVILVMLWCLCRETAAGSLPRQHFMLPNPGNGYGSLDPDSEPTKAGILSTYKIEAPLELS
ncbi:hypothetical protein BU15DRAFT_66317 [Melanogaster broomeanus]|nr:hypothetical protein BU15DRAFT_66317 [Melanogaster broomeanus]